MARTGLSKIMIVEKAAQMVNESGIEQMTLKDLANELGVKTPSLYNHIEGIDELKKQLILFGWSQMEHRMIHAVIGVSGYDAIKAICYAFYDFASENTGIFHVMLWYNKFQDEEMSKATSQLLSIIFKVASSFHFREDFCYHLIRTFRGFLEGFFLLVNHESFGHPLPVRDSFEISLNILIEGVKAVGADYQNEIQTDRSRSGYDKICSK